MKTILDILKLDYKSYDDYRFSCFFKWCSIYTEFGLPLQTLVTSKILYGWYCQQWMAVVEGAFKQDCKVYLEAAIHSPNTYLELMATYPGSIEGYYPKALFNIIKNELKPQTKNEVHSNRTA